MSPIFYIPTARVTVCNPPMPRLMEHGSVVLCGVDICGARWPLCSGSTVVLSGPFRATVALARTWDDAPRTFMLTVRCTDAGGSIVAAASRRRIGGLVPDTLGLETALATAGQYSIQVSVLADSTGCGEFSEIFVLPAVTVNVPAAAVPAAVAAAAPTAAPAVEPMAETPVPIKVSYVDGDHPAVIRRLTFPAQGAAPGGPLYEELIAALRAAFRAELPPSAASRLTYVDDEGDEVAVSSDAEVADALRLHRSLMLRCPGAGALRMTLARA
jgi:hypothetical protein